MITRTSSAKQESPIVSSPSIKNDTVPASSPSVKTDVSPAPSPRAPAPALTRRETKRKPSRPSKELLQYIKSLRDRLADSLKDTPEMADKLTALNSIYHDLRTMIDDDEAHRDEFAVEITTLQAQDKMREQLEKIESDYNEQFVAYQQKVDALRDKIKELHDKIEEAQGQTMIDNIRKMVTYQQLHNEIREKMNKINNTIESRGCFAKLFCCTPAEVSKLQDELDQLDHQRTLLSADDPAAVGKIVAAVIETERAAAEEELAKLIKDQPRRVNDALIKQLAESEASIELNRTQYYHAMSQAVMYLLVRIYALLGRIQRLFSSQKGNDKSAALKKSVSESRDKLHNKLEDFYSTNYDDNQTTVTFDQYYSKFHVLSETDQRAIVYGKASAAQKAKVFSEQTGDAAPAAPSPRS